MEVLALDGFGAPDVLQSARRPVPAPAPGQLLVRVAACGVCGHDVLARRGLLAATAGQVLGHEISGRVVGVGSPEDAEAWQDHRVALVQRIPCGRCRDCHEGRSNHCRQGPGFYGDDLPGGYSEYVVASPLNAVQIPDTIDDVTAALLPCAVGTAFRALRTAEVAEGDVVVVTGAGGGVGTSTVEMAAALGHHVVAVTGSASKAGRLTALGASVVLVDPDDDELRSATTALGRPRGADAVIELTGIARFEQAHRSLAPRGRLVCVGNIDPGRAPLDLGRTIVRELQVRGSAHATRDDLVEVVEMVAQGRLSPVVAGSWPLRDGAEVHRAMESQTITGRAVLCP